MDNSKEYKGLKYLTRGNVSPQGRPRVYFCCHPEDFEKTFDAVTKEILDIQINAAVWYYDPANGIPSGEAFEADLATMNLFVVPVTSRFIFQDNPARVTEFAFAVSHRIPVLPLMQENGLEEDFNRVCGDLQCLNKQQSQMDPTALPYGEKLKKYLNAVLVSDELAKQIRDAFDAYIFLSYRKKDRTYAQQIMHLIHENEFCRDVAIWYDEFLTPGENFNQAIREALQKSCLFAMVVTPNLLEKPNYVMVTEYPEARKAGKTILPIEAAETDRDGMRADFEALGEIVSTRDSEQLSRLLQIALGEVADRDNRSTPQHLFFMGLAYLAGIDLEVNHEKARSLIERAAEGNLPEAYEKLVSMYNTGEGVERNYHTAALWQEKYADMLERTQEDPDSNRQLVDVLGKLGDMWLATENMAKTHEAYERTIKHALLREKKYPSNEARRDLAISYERLGDFYEYEGNLEEAKQYYGNAFELFEILARETGTVESRRDLSINYNKIGNICWAEGKLADAMQYYLKDVKISEELVGETGATMSRRDLSIGYRNCGDACRAEGRLEEAKQYYLKSLEISEMLVGETGAEMFRRDLSIAYNRLGYVCQLEKNLEEAKQYYLKYHEISEELFKETRSIRSRRNLHTSYILLGTIYEKERNLKEAKQYYGMAQEIIEKLVQETGTVESRRDLAVSYNKLGTVCQLEGKLKEAKQYYLKTLEIREMLFQKTGAIWSRKDLSFSYNKLGNICKAEGNLVEAEQYYEKSREMKRSLA